jgi:hypothetical protein
MKNIFTMILLLLSISIARSQYSIVVLDSIKDGIKYKDNALLFQPEGFTEPQKSYVIKEIKDDNDLTFNSITLFDSVLNNVTGLYKNWPSFDYVFPNTIDRTPGDTIVVEFDLMYAGAGGSGEGGRMQVTLLTDLPSDGITATDFGDPAYHFWLFNGGYAACLSYGGEFTLTTPAGTQEPMDIITMKTLEIPILPFYMPKPMITPWYPILKINQAIHYISLRPNGNIIHG